MVCWLLSSLYLFLLPQAWIHTTGLSDYIHVALWFPNTQCCHGKILLDGLSSQNSSTGISCHLVANEVFRCQWVNIETIEIPQISSRGLNLTLTFQPHTCAQREFHKYPQTQWHTHKNLTQKDLWWTARLLTFRKCCNVSSSVSECLCVCMCFCVCLYSWERAS